MPEAAVSELIIGLGMAGSVVGIPVTLERLLPADRIAPQRLLEALVLAAALAAVAHGRIDEAGSRAVALGVIIFSALRVRRHPWPAHADEPTSRETKYAHAPGDPLVAVAAFGINGLVQPIGPAALLHGWGMLTAAIYLYSSSQLRLLANMVAAFALFSTANSLFE
jgi:hypothetical protein